MYNIFLPVNMWEKQNTVFQSSTAFLRKTEFIFNLKKTCGSPSGGPFTDTFIEILCIYAHKQSHGDYNA